MLTRVALVYNGAWRKNKKGRMFHISTREK
jgi:hypothetical protein